MLAGVEMDSRRGRSPQFCIKQSGSNSAVVRAFSRILGAFGSVEGGMGARWGGWDGGGEEKVFGGGIHRARWDRSDKWAQHTKERQQRHNGRRAAPIGWPPAPTETTEFRVHRQWSGIRRGGREGAAAKQAAPMFVNCCVYQFGLPAGIDCLGGREK